MTAPPPRAAAVRRRDTLALLERETDCWVATAGADGRPYLLPLSLDWDGERIVLATAARSRTARNLARGPVRIALGATRDVVVVDGEAELVPANAVPARVADAYAARSGWDPRASGENVFAFVRPVRIQAWREENELAARELMRDGRWLA